MNEDEEPHGFTVEGLLGRYMRRFHEGPIVQGPALVQLSCATCKASVVFDPVLWGVFMVDFPPQIVL